jgi:nitroreductase/NAD-dependent dihydropyrimidine dehydrogenase PreA subunit
MKPTALFTIDHEKCSRDGLCVADCPAGIIAMTERGPVPVAGAKQMCINCGHCVAVCPHGALALATMPLEQCPALPDGWHLEPGRMEQLLKGRRSVRSYRQEPVPREVLARVIDMARYAPTAGNAQALHWTVIHDASEVRRSAEAVIDWLREASQTPPMAWAGTLVTDWDRGMDPVCRSAPHLILVHAPAEPAQMAVANGAIALTFAELAAVSYGLGTCWAGFVMMAADRSEAVAAALRLPAGHKLLGGMMIGYPKVNYHRIPLRDEAKLAWR